AYHPPKSAGLSFPAQEAAMHVSPTHANAEPNVIPMIDVLLVLLIIFMLMITERHLIWAQLPAQIESASPDPVPNVLEVRRNGYAINGQAMNAHELAPRLRALYASRPDKAMLVHGDSGVTYQHVITAIDIAKGAGVGVIGLYHGSSR
ncbi:MAG: biopolymer transporter ExbD, partial [Gemmatimonadota bacterium]|nr:biopolymer transporter ExbD [Gemmatimonadota bacterium]